MSKKRKPKKLPFEAISIGDHCRARDERRARLENKAARNNTSAVTVYKPDSEGNLVATEEIAAPKPERMSRNRNAKRIWSTL